MRLTNEEIRTRAGIETISKQGARRRWTWPGHVLRMGPPLTSTNRPHMGTRRQKESRDLKKNSGKGAKGERIENLGRGSIS